MHRLLQRQLRRHDIDPTDLPADVQKLLIDVATAYQEFDDDRRLVERSLDLTSQELVERNRELGRDVEERRRVAQLLRHVIESVGDGILVVDGDGCILDRNERFLEMWRISLARSEELREERDIARFMEDLEDHEGHLRAMQAQGAGGGQTADTVLRFRDGRIFEMSCRPLPGHGRGRVWRFRDVTEQRRLEAQLLQSQKMEAVGQLAGGIAHDFNNMLMAIIGFSRLLLEDLAGTPAADDLREVLSAAERATTLTGRLLAFSRREMKAPVVLDPAAVVAGMGELLRRLLGEQIHLETRGAPDSGFVRMDRGHLEQIVMNLAVNARDAMPGGGEIVIAVERLETGSHELGGGPQMRLRVSDTGCGMDVATVARIFEPFFTTKEPGRGTGLGLSTVYGIVQQSGGCIEVDSQPGRGTIFSVYFPLAQDRPPPDETAPRALPGGTETVLVVEDDAAVRIVVKRMLQSRGYRILEASSGQDAIALCHAHEGPLHLLLTDVVMPDMFGPEVARRIASLRPGIGVLFMSGYTEGAAAEAVAASGALLVRKPFTHGLLESSVRRVLDGLSDSPTPAP